MSRHLALAKAVVMIAEPLEQRHLLSGYFLNLVWPTDPIGPATVRTLDEIESSLRIDPGLVNTLLTPKLRGAGRGVSIASSGVQPDLSYSAPALANSWDAINFDQDASNTGFYSMPPDNHGAAGPNHVVNVVNSSIQWFTHQGVSQVSQRLGKNSSGVTGSFFEPLNPANGLFDPKVVYDQYAGRFVVVALEQTDVAQGDATNSSRVLVAASDDSDPNGTWYYQALNTKMNIGGTERWFDYPGLSISSTAIYLTGNMFGFGSGNFGGSRLWIFDKSGLYAGGAAAVNMYDPGALTGVGSLFTPQPAQMFGAEPASTGTFLVTSGFSQGLSERISVIRVSNPLASPTFLNTMIDAGNISSGFSAPASPQLGTTTTIDSGDGRILSAVWRNDSLYFVNTVNPPSTADAGTATAHWYRVNASSSTVSLAEQGNIGGEDLSANTRTYYPAIMVDASSNVAVGFSASSPTLYAGAYYTGRLSTESTFQPTSTLAAGQDYYIRKFGGSANRWGDYSGISLDPSNESTFWVFNQYAATRGTILPSYPSQDGRWATRWGSFSLSALPATPTSVSLDPLFDTGLSNTDALTRLNNVSPASALQFVVTGTTAGATAEIYADGVLIGSAPASDNTTLVLTDGATALADGARVITARQTSGSASSTDSPSASVTVDTIAPSLFSFTVNDGAAQRSMITSLSAVFSEPVDASAALELTDSFGFANPNITVSIDNPSFDLMSYMLTFTGSAVLGQSLPDGHYRLTATTSLTDIAGNTLPIPEIRTFHRLFGDTNGSRDIDSDDVAQFKSAYDQPGNYIWYLDYDGDALINDTDRLALMARIAPPVL